MKKVIMNEEGISDDEVEMRERRIKVLIRNSRGELLVCNVDGVYHFVGGHPEKNETIEECAKREIEEETGISIEQEALIPFLELQQYKKNYFGTQKNGLATITYIDCQSERRPNIENRQLDEQEAKKQFHLEYIKLEDAMDILRKNKIVAESQKKGFIVTEMMYVLSEYLKRLEKNAKESER